MRLKRLQTLTLSVLLIAGPLLSAQQQAVQQQQVIAEIKRLRGQVKRDASAPDKPVISVDLHGTHISDAGLEHLRSLTKLQTLNLYHTKVTDAGLAHLESLTGLTPLDLQPTFTTDP